MMLGVRIGRATLKLARTLKRKVESWESSLSRRFPLPPHIVVQEKEGVLYVSERELPAVAIAHKDRARLYRVGIVRRLESLANDYCFAPDFFSQPRVFVDVGANVGEFGILVEKVGGHYIGIEPDPIAHRALRKNVASTDVYDFAVSNQEGTQTFFLKPDSADSSLFPPTDFDGKRIDVRVLTLDRLAELEDFPARIDAIKIEAEGMEPEVIAGATKVLKAASVCSVDAGPERGGKSTAPDVVTLLYGLGFELVDFNPRRQAFLFENKNVTPLR